MDRVNLAVSASRHRCIAGGCGNWLHQSKPLCPEHVSSLGSELATKVERAYRDRGWAPSAYTAAVRELFQTLNNSKGARK